MKSSDWEIIGLFEMANGNESIAYFIPGSSRSVQRGQPYMVFSVYSGTWQTKENPSGIF